MNAPDVVMVVEPDVEGRWLVSLVDASRRAILSRRLVEAAPLRDPGPRCIQRLGSRLVGEAGDAGCILLLVDRLASRDTLSPSLLTSFPVPMYAASPSLAIASAVPEPARRFALLDFHGRGSLALVRRSDTGIADYSRHAKDLFAYLGVKDRRESKYGDLLLDECGAETATRESLEPFFRTLHDRFGPLLDWARSFGFETLACASQIFDDAAAAALFRSIFADRRRDQLQIINTRLARAVAGAYLMSERASTPGIWVTPKRRGQTISMRALRAIDYNVRHVERHVFDLDEPALGQLLDSRPAMVVVDRLVHRMYGDALDRYAKRHLTCLDVVTVDGREESKTWAQVEDICQHAIDLGLRRDGVIVAVGGGITLDIAGLAASLYRRGIRFVRVPTTLVGMVDVCVGIKQAVNHGRKKNILGAFYPPFGGINDLTFLKTLSGRHVACGVSEILKMAVLRDPLLFELIEAYAPRLIASNFQKPQAAAHQIVVRAELAMMRELQPNLFEGDLRRFVDFGHSFSPSLESTSGYQLHHGEAVALDMLLSASLAVRRGICAASVVRRMAALYRIVGLPVSHPLCRANALVESLRDVRIHRGGDLNLVVPTAIGAATFIQEVDDEEVAAAISDLEALARDSEETAVHVHAVAGG